MPVTLDATPAVAGTWAVVPAKSFARAKSRLSGSLDDARRREIARDMLAHVVRTARACEGVSGVLVATDGDDVANTCTDEATILHDRPEDSGQLGAVVDRALSALAERGARAAVVVMSDLPELRAADLAHLVAALDTADIAVAPDRREAGTNAIAVRLPAALPSELGHGDSFARHLDAAHRRGLAAIVVRTDNLAHDVDVASDL